MKKFTSGLLIGLLIGLLTATTTFAMAGDVIKLIINGKEIACDVPPQNIDGRIMVPARYVAESLGATAEWDVTQNAVVITDQQVIEESISSTTTNTVTTTTNDGLEYNPYTRLDSLPISGNASRVNGISEITWTENAEGTKNASVIVNITNLTDKYQTSTGFRAIFNIDDGRKYQFRSDDDYLLKQKDAYTGLYICPNATYEKKYIIKNLPSKYQVLGWEMRLDER